MGKQYFFIKLIPPRATFAQDMSPHERALMRQHAAYVREFFERGEVLAYGPVLDPQGSFGMAILEMTDLCEAERFAEDDPTVHAGLNRYSIAPMMLGGAQGSRAPENGSTVAVR